MSRYSSDDDEESVSYTAPTMTTDEAKTFLHLDPNRPNLSCDQPLDEWTPPTRSHCTIAWSLGSLLAQGTMAYIFDGCESLDMCPTVVRVAPLDTTDTKFQTDSIIRHLLTCRFNGAVTPLLYDAFVCSVEKRYGITVMEKYDGDLVDLIVKHPDIVNMNNIRHQLQGLVQQIQSVSVVHRDLGWQNVLFRQDGPTVKLVLTDFEDGKWFSSLSVSDERQWSAFSNNDVAQIDAVMEQLQTVIAFLNVFDEVKSVDPNILDMDSEVRQVWHSLDTFEADKLRKVLHLSEDWLDYLEADVAGSRRSSFASD